MRGGLRMFSEERYIMFKLGIKRISALLLPVLVITGSMGFSMIIQADEVKGNERQSTIVLESPQDYQVFQRSSRIEGKIRVRGKINSEFISVKIKLSGESIIGSLLDEWQDISVETQTGEFDTELPVSAGGWYTFEIQAIKDADVIDKVVIGHVGVGEVFLGAGQSNSTNYGETKQTTKTDMVSSYGGMKWQLADDPQPGAQDSSKAGSFWPVFGDDMYAKYNVPIGISVTGSGSTSVNQWQPNGTILSYMPTSKKYVKEIGNGQYEVTGQLFDGLVKRINALGPNGFRAILWHQGESDANQAPPVPQLTSEEYAAALTNIITKTQEAAGWQMPWFVAQVSYHSPDDTHCDVIRDGQKALWDAGTALEGPDTDTLTGDNRQNKGKGVHMSDQGLKAHGKMWADKVSIYLDKVLADSDPGQGD